MRLSNGEDKVRIVRGGREHDDRVRAGANDQLRSAPCAERCSRGRVGLHHECLSELGLHAASEVAERHHGGP
eukprot:9941931-Alexandrium_andersonii.AAC.1